MKVGIPINQMDKKIQINLEQEYKSLQIFRDDYEDILNKDYIYDSPEVDVIANSIENYFEESLVD